MISFSEILVVFVVALIALGPKQWPRLIFYCGQFALKLSKAKGHFSEQWEKFLAEQRLVDSEHRATQAAKHYQKHEQENEHE